MRTRIIEEEVFLKKMVAGVWSITIKGNKTPVKMEDAKLNYQEATFLFSCLVNVRGLKML